MTIHLSGFLYMPCLLLTILRWRDMRKRSSVHQHRSEHLLHVHHQANILRIARVKYLRNILATQPLKRMRHKPPGSDYQYVLTNSTNLGSLIVILWLLSVVVELITFGWSFNLLTSWWQEAVLASTLGALSYLNLWEDAWQSIVLNYNN